MERVPVALGQMQKPHESGLTLEECADRGLLVPTNDQITFPVSRFAAVLG